ncbi:23S rRNA (pseudouridine(1915)-N(3))-methyltransferase RlmH [Candidatus Peregrinibacteria bacterium]|nr:MAG: 23S rRNA (pseudouridine(1915)-N(3))-methyltransferase RlmH [Candidatus Peregrinibacteria bacterium]
MVLHFIFVGKTKDSWLQEGMKIFEKRLKKHVSYTIDEVKDCGERGEEKEKEKIISAMKSGVSYYLLDVKGKQISSHDFAKLFQKEQEKTGKVGFIIAGAYGASTSLIEKYPLLSFSNMTFTHQMLRPFVLEQVYRAFEILKGSDYHK